MGLIVAIPDTSLLNCSNLRDKTVKVGQLARAFAISCVDRVIIYSTKKIRLEQKRDADLLQRLLLFMDTPQYLRRKIFLRAPSLKFTGILPPLRTRSHPLAPKMSDILVGDVRWGVQVRTGKIDIGLEKLVDYNSILSERDPTLFRIAKISPLKLEVIMRKSVANYFGYEVERSNNLIQLLEKHMTSTRIAFSRNAPMYYHIESDIKSTVSNTKSIVAVFGGPRYGIGELLVHEKDALKNNIDFWVNSIPNQGTETVRLEEAVLMSLALLNNSLGALITKPGYHS